MVKYGSFSHKIDYVPIFEENLNLKGHLNRFIGSKVTAILVNGGFYLGVELHWEGSAPAACAAGLFTRYLMGILFKLCIYVYNLEN